MKKENFRLKEQINHKVISMIDLAVEDIFDPKSEYQSGEKSVNAGFLDQYGNRFDLQINLSVTSGAPVEEPTPDRLDEILSRIETLENYHKKIEDSPSTDTPVTDNTGDDDGDDNP